MTYRSIVSRFLTRRVALLLVACISLGGIWYWWVYHVPNQRASKPGVVAIANTDNDDRRADIVFVHGLGGNGTDTWTCDANGFYWPKELGQDERDLGIWVVNYDANASDWLGGTMPIENRSKNLLEQLSLAGIGEKPVIFIGHSLGGILVKQMLKDAVQMENDNWQPIAARTRGVVFVGTPHAGSDMANYLMLLGKEVPVARVNVTAQQLMSDSVMLDELGNWYRNTSEIEVKNQAFVENPIDGSVVVVSLSSSNPGLNGVTPIRVEGNHISMAKPCTKQDMIYGSTRRFINQEAAPFPGDWPAPYSECLAEFKEARETNALAEFKKKHVNQQVTWDAVVIEVNDRKKEPTYVIAISEDALPSEQVVANISSKKFKSDIKKGTPITITGVIKDTTSRNGIILDRCKIIKSE